jgi:bleomycin hydrolase
VSEKTFSSKHGVAVIPSNETNAKIAVLGPENEKQITQTYRQDEFENYNTTDDHLMHITGKAKDQNGTIYYKVKNSWGTDSNRTKYDGYVYMSASYIKLKAISVLMHKDALLSSTKKKISL